MSVEEIMQQVREIYGDDSLAMLEDEDTDADPVLQGADRVSFIDVSRFWNSVSWSSLLGVVSFLISQFPHFMEVPFNAP